MQESLANHLPSNATFLAERLVAESDTEENRILLANCYLMEEKPYKAYSVLKNCKSDMARYKFAVSCLKLKKFKEGEKCLLKSSQAPPNGGFGYHLLAQLFENQRKYQEA